MSVLSALVLMSECLALMEYSCQDVKGNVKRGPQGHIIPVIPKSVMIFVFVLLNIVPGVYQM